MDFFFFKQMEDVNEAFFILERRITIFEKQ